MAKRYTVAADNVNGVTQYEKNHTGEIIAMRGNIIDSRFPQPLPPRN
jgi:hypothetical protein